MLDTYRNLASILSDDRKTTTYKFALLRGTIEIIGANSPYIQLSEREVSIPTGLLVEKWILYYYPLLESQIKLPQAGRGVSLAFEKHLKHLIEFYSKKPNGGMSALSLDLRSKGIPSQIQAEFNELVSQIRTTVNGMPMKHLGYSITRREYSIFRPEKNHRKAQFSTTLDLIESCGYYSIPVEYYHLFKSLGSFLLGEQSILMQWAQFSVNASPGVITLESALQELIRVPSLEREMIDSRKIFDRLDNQNDLFCVWTGKRISKYALDHLVPFSVWRNNDLWNMLPCDEKVNGNKGNKIPTSGLINNQRELIIHYWRHILTQPEYTDRFKKECVLTLLGHETPTEFEHACLSKLINACEYLIQERGFEPWEMNR